MTKVRFELRKWQHFLALGFGSGLSPRAPGTMGTLVAIPIVWLLSQFGLVWYTGLLLAGTILGIYICGKTAQDVGEHDHGAIVWDEIIGYMLTMLFVPVTWLTLLLGFLLFRFFDILKPWPICWFDKHVQGGLGIMLDDILAGIAAATVLVLWVYLTGLA